MSSLFHPAPHSTLRFREPRKNRLRVEKGFTLLELLVVVAIMAILLSIMIMSISGVKGGRDLAKATYDIQGILEQARTTAMATGTYTWVGFYEEDPTTPGTAGKGQVVISIVSSTAGSNLAPISGTPVAALPTTDSAGRTLLVQVNKLIRLPNVHLASAPDDSADGNGDDVISTSPALVTRPAPASDNYHVGDSHFANTTTFQYPLTGTAQYTFTKIIQFNPQGDASRISDSPTPVIEIGLLPTHSHTLPPKPTNAAVVQVAGIGGQVITYKP